MPNRILHERICVSETIAELSADEERFFYRLIVQCDDYGRFDGRASVIRARCFPLQLSAVSDEDVVRWLSRLISIGLVVTYMVAERAYLRVATWERYQQTRAKRSKFPDPEDGSPASASTCLQTPEDAGIGHRYPVNENRESEIESRESRSDSPPLASLDPPTGGSPQTPRKRGAPPAPSARRSEGRASKRSPPGALARASPRRNGAAGGPRESIDHTPEVNAALDAWEAQANAHTAG